MGQWLISHHLIGQSADLPEWNSRQEHVDRAEILHHQMFEYLTWVDNHVIGQDSTVAIFNSHNPIVRPSQRHDASYGIAAIQFSF